ncbi:hypothetical protein [Stenotrophomonas sp. GD03657]|uniref:hypothetical protein n=1 Tax=Stenotrophomonas sp. GD03657 TaxID=2975363 RepID=UPI0024478363|nr:hypothetical protein [Stenotrophomonas sp. GD03657]MDH2154071.1 hypothetical protein [Stenotrophomonas sp. GD03657]
MKSFKERFLESWPKNDIERLYKAELNLYETNGQNARLPFHNGIHIRALLRMVVTLRKLDGLTSVGIVPKAAEIASVFHDLGHAGYPDTWIDSTGRDNIDRAIDGLRESPIINRYPDSCIEMAKDMIRSTRFPHTPHTYPANTPADAIRHYEYIRDADCMWGMIPMFTQHALWALALENGGNVIHDEAEVDWDKRAEIQIGFFRAYTPASNIGRSFKNAFVDDAIAGTLQAAEILKKDPPLKKLASALANTGVGR